MEEVQKKEPEKPIEERIDVDKYFKECMNGREAYRALQLFLKKWWELTGEEIFMVLISGMHIDGGMEADWARAVKATIDGRKDGKRNYVYKWVTDLVKDSCNCDTCPCKQCEPK